MREAVISVPLGILFGFYFFFSFGGLVFFSLMSFSNQKYFM